MRPVFDYGSRRVANWSSSSPQSRLSSSRGYDDSHHHHDHPRSQQPIRKRRIDPYEHYHHEPDLGTTRKHASGSTFASAAAPLPVAPIRNVRQRDSRGGYSQPPVLHHHQQNRRHSHEGRRMPPPSSGRPTMVYPEEDRTPVARSSHYEPEPDYHTVKAAIPFNSNSGLTGFNPDRGTPTGSGFGNISSHASETETANQFAKTWRPFLGQPMQDRTIPGLGYGNTQQTPTLPYAYTGQNYYMESIINTIVTEQHMFPVTHLLPWTEYRGPHRIVFDQIHFDQQILSILPPLSVPRLVTFRYSSNHVQLLRQGIGMNLEFDFAMTPKGQQFWAHQTYQIANAVSISASLQAQLALLNPTYNQLDDADRANMDIDSVASADNWLDAVIQDTFGLNKYANFFTRHLSESETWMERRMTGQTGDTIVAPSGTKHYFQNTPYRGNLIHNKRETVNVKPGRLCIWISPNYPQGPGNRPYDPLWTIKQFAHFCFAGYHHSRHVPLERWTTDMMDIRVYSDKTDSDHHRLSYRHHLPYAGLFNLPLKTPFGSEPRPIPPSQHGQLTELGRNVTKGYKTWGSYMTSKGITPSWQRALCADKDKLQAFLRKFSKWESEEQFDKSYPDLTPWVSPSSIPSLGVGSTGSAPSKRSTNVITLRDRFKNSSQPNRILGIRAADWLSQFEGDLLQRLCDELSALLPTSSTGIGHPSDWLLAILRFDQFVYEQMEKEAKSPTYYAIVLEPVGRDSSSDTLTRSGATLFRLAKLSESQAIKCLERGVPVFNNGSGAVTATMTTPAAKEWQEFSILLWNFLDDIFNNRTTVILTHTPKVQDFQNRCKSSNVKRTLDEKYGTTALWLRPVVEYVNGMIGNHTISLEHNELLKSVWPKIRSEASSYETYKTTDDEKLTLAELDARFGIIAAKLPVRTTGSAFSRGVLRGELAGYSADGEPYVIDDTFEDLIVNLGIMGIPSIKDDALTLYYLRHKSPLDSSRKLTLTDVRKILVVVDTIAGWMQRSDIPHAAVTQFVDMLLVHVTESQSFETIDITNQILTWYTKNGDRNVEATATSVFHWLGGLYKKIRDSRKLDLGSTVPLKFTDEKFDVSSYDVSTATEAERKGTLMVPYNTLTDEQKRVLIQRILNMTPITWSLVEFGMDQDLPPIFNLLYVRQQRYKSGVIIHMLRDGVAGATLKDKMNFMVSINTANQLIGGNLSVYLKPIVFTPKAVIHWKDCVAQSYEGGGHIDVYNPLDPDVVERYRKYRISNYDLFVLAVPATEILDTHNRLDLTGYAHKAFVPNIGRAASPYYSTAEAYAQFWGWQHDERNPLLQDVNPSSLDPTKCTLIMRDGFWVYGGERVGKSNNESMNQRIISAGIWGQGIFKGCKAARFGKGRSLAQEHDAWAQSLRS